MPARLKGASRQASLTRLGEYLKESGTSHRWLAKQIYVSPSNVSRWCAGLEAMAPSYREEILRVLRQRAALSLEGLFEDQIDPLTLGCRRG